MCLFEINDLLEDISVYCFISLAMDSFLFTSNGLMKIMKLWVSLLLDNPPFSVLKFYFLSVCNLGRSVFDQLLEKKVASFERWTCIHN